MSQWLRPTANYRPKMKKVEGRHRQKANIIGYWIFGGLLAVVLTLVLTS